VVSPPENTINRISKALFLKGESQISAPCNLNKKVDFDVDFDDELIRQFWPDEA